MPSWLLNCYWSAFFESLGMWIIQLLKNNNWFNCFINSKVGLWIIEKKITHWKLVFIDSHIVSLRQAQGPEEMCLSKTRRKPLKKWVILIALRFRYTFYIPQTKRLRARKAGLQYKIRTSCLGRPSGDVLCASEAMACGYWFSKWLTTKSIWVR